MASTGKYIIAAVGLSVLLLVAGAWHIVFSEPTAGFVSGVVTLDGQPLEAALVIFYADEDSTLIPAYGRTARRYAGPG